jgi:hypothetical protein
MNIGQKIRTFSKDPVRVGTFALASRVGSFLFAAAVLVACDDVVSDPTFREWCGDTLCAWKLEEGHISRAPTWTDKDYGVAFLDTPTTISQEVTQSPTCLKFSTIADIDPAAQMEVAIDFDRDGTIDAHQPIASAQWTEVTTLVTAPATYDGFTLYVKKEGTGNAVLAQFRVQSSTDCTAAAIPLGHLPIGDRCDPSSATACETGICCEGMCAECCSDTDCHGASTTDGGGDAGAGNICRAITVPEPQAFGVSIPTAPKQCNPGDHHHASGAPCIANDDCTSGTCDGAIVRAQTDDPDASDCSVTLPNAGTCIVNQIAGGHCR